MTMRYDGWQRWQTRYDDDELPGGTAENYASHISDAVDELASVYTAHHPQATFRRPENSSLTTFPTL